MALTIRNCIALVLSVVLAAALSGCHDDGSTAPASFSISGSPQTQVKVGTAYQFRPTATADPGTTLSFSVSNLPAWAQFDPKTGMLTGQPKPADVGVYAKISITVSDGATSTALAPFSISVQPASTSASLAISGTPATTVAAGASYNFHPTATPKTNAKLTFSISHQPAWAKFDAGTGTLTGTPSTSNVGTFANIAISVSDGTSTAALPSFSIVVTQLASAAVNVTWTTPTPTADPAASELAGYHIYYGSSSSAMTHVVNVADPGATSHAISGVAHGTWYFAVASYNTEQIESALSPILAAELL